MGNDLPKVVVQLCGRATIFLLCQLIFTLMHIPIAGAREVMASFQKRAPTGELSQMNKGTDLRPEETPLSCSHLSLKRVTRTFLSEGKEWDHLQQYLRMLNKHLLFYSGSFFPLFSSLYCCGVETG